MLLLVDHNVPDAVATFVQRRGHDVHLVRHVLAITAPDLVIAKLAQQMKAIVLTWNVRDFDRFLSRASREENVVRFRDAGMIRMACPEARGMRRLEQAMPLIEFEHQHLQSLPDKRLFVTIDRDSIRVVR